VFPLWLKGTKLSIAPGSRLKFCCSCDFVTAGLGCSSNGSARLKGPKLRMPGSSEASIDPPEGQVARAGWGMAVLVGAALNL
jgi:hypothetical protein